MLTSVEDGSLERFRDEARAVRERADWQIFGLLCTAALSITFIFAVVIIGWMPRSIFLWPIVGGMLLSAGAALWTRRTKRIETGIALLATMMTVGVFAIILIQRGSNAPAVVYGLTTVAVVLIAGRGRLGVRLGLALTTWTAAVTWASRTGRLSIDASNPLGLDNARLLALVIALILIGLAAHIVRRRRLGLDAILERALQFTEAERDEAQSLADRRARKVAEIGHEIRTPMTGIVGAAQLLSQKSLSPVQRQLLSIQRQSAERLLQLVNAILDQAKIESAPLALVKAPYVPRLVASEVTELFAPQANRKGVEIIWTADPAFPPSVLGDAMRVRQILSNLVSNAVKFTHRGSVQVHLFQPAPGGLRFEVRDTGQGVAPDRLEAIFERFVSDAGIDARSRGTGLGLPISRELARAMGGDISVISEVAQGSCFALDLPCSVVPSESAEERFGDPTPAGRLWVVGASAPLEVQLRFMLGDLGVDARFLDRPPSKAEWADAGAFAQALLVDTWVGHGHCTDLLPVIRDNARRDGGRVIVVSSVAQDAAFGILDDVWQVFRPPSRDALREALAWAFDSGAPPAPGMRTDASRLRILLVDDNTVNQIIGKVMLEELGAEVVVVHAGQAALDEALRRPFDLILMDLQMPEMDGLEATRRLRTLERDQGLPRTPVVAVTGQVAFDIDGACRDSGMDGVLPKPYTIDQLRAVVESHSTQTNA